MDQPLKIGLSQRRETHFSPFPLTYFLHLFSPCVTLVTAKKTKLLLGCARGCARVRALRVGAKTSAFFTNFFASLFRQFFPSGFFEMIFHVNLLLRFHWSQTKHTPKHPIMLHQNNKSNTSHNKFFTFPRFFPSLERFRPIYL